MIDQNAALIYTMVLVSAADSDMTDAELATIGDIVRHLPIFAKFDNEKLPETASVCADLLAGENGLEHTIDVIRDALTEPLRETAYALACDVVAVDARVTQEELRVLELLRHRLDIDRLVAAGIERGARARYVRA